jgi:hypothetical protein
MPAYQSSRLQSGHPRIPDLAMTIKAGASTNDDDCRQPLSALGNPFHVRTKREIKPGS